MAVKFFLSLWTLSLCSSWAAERPNVLLICIDDLRPELGCYGKEYIHSPNIDSLAQQGTLFEHHYVQAPTCGASRYAMLTGTYGPAGNNALFDRAKKLKKEGDAAPSLPGWFREQGYTTVAVGKVSHHAGGLGGADWDDESQLEMPNSWDRNLLPAGAWLHPRGWMHGLANGEIRKKEGRMNVFQAHEGGDECYPDGVAIPVAVEQLQILAKEEKPFFLAVGVLRPHLPFGAPKKYLDLYEGVQLPAIPDPQKPKGETTWHKSGEFMKYHRWGKNPNEDEDFAQEVRRHYAACVSYADATVGEVLTALEKSGEKENTVIVLWGDHGWHLGEHAVWGKHTLFEESLHAPLIVVSPNKKGNQRVGEIVQSVDLFPTLCELASVEKPNSLVGKSLFERREDSFAYSYETGNETIRVPSARLISHQSGHQELYFYKDGKRSRENMAEEMPELLEKLRKQLSELRESH